MLPGGQSEQRVTDVSELHGRVGGCMACCVEHRNVHWAGHGKFRFHVGLVKCGMREISKRRAYDC
jgi:hypothetical protein